MSTAPNPGAGQPPPPPPPAPVQTVVITQPAPAPPKSHTTHAVTFVGYPKLLFTYPLILAGFLFWFFAAPADGYAERLETLGWVYITISLLVVLTVGVDVGRNQAIFWAVLILALWALNLWLTDAKSIPVFGTILAWFDGLNVQYNRSFGLALSIILTIPFVLLLGWAQLNDRWRITHNEFEHYSFGRADDSLGRGAKAIRSEYPDVFEFLLAGAGTLIVFNASGTQELRRIPHVLMLSRVQKKLAKILEFTAVTGAVAEDGEEQ